MDQPLRNLITDVAGLSVGNADDPRLKSGVTVVVCDEPAVASGHVMGGAPGTRETDLLAPEAMVEAVDAVVLSGGSAFGLDAAGGVMAALAAAGRGFVVGSARVPIVPAAILFDLLNGGDKDWGDTPPYAALGRAALAAARETFALGSAGAGIGATTANLKGGLGSASMRLPGGITVAALAAVNAVGQATIGDGPNFWAGPFERDGEFGGLASPAAFGDDATRLNHKTRARPGESTTIAVVATDARLDKAGAKRLAVVAHDGIAHAIWPAHTAFDGDLVFALATQRAGGTADADVVAIGAAAAACLTRAIARGVYEATPAPDDLVPTWRERFGGQIASRTTP